MFTKRSFLIEGYICMIFLKLLNHSVVALNVPVVTLYFMNILLINQCTYYKQKKTQVNRKKINFSNHILILISMS